MAVNIGPKIGIDGEAEFRKEINDLIQQQKTLASEMKAVTSAFDKNDKSQENLEGQSRVLTKQIETQEQKIQKLKQGLEAATNQFGEADSRTQKWQQAVNEATADLNGMSRALDNVGNDLDDINGKNFSFGDAFKADALVEGIKSIAGAVTDVIDSTSEYRKIMGTLEVSSQNAGYTAEQTAATYRQLFGVLGDTQTAATTTANLQALGLSQEQLTQLTNSAIGAWATYGDSIPIDSLSEAINETIRTGTVTGTFADVLNWAGQSEDQFNEKLAAANTETERANIVLQAMADQGLASAGEQWQQTNSDIVNANNAQEDFNEAMSQLAEVLSPVATAVAGVVADLAQKIADFATWMKDALAAGDPLAAVLIAVAAAAGTLAIAMGISSLIQGVTGAFAAFNAVLNANPIILIVTLIAGLVAAIMTLWTTNDNFRSSVIEIGTAIKDFVSGIVDSIIEFFTVTIPSAFQTVIDFIKNNWQGLLLLLVNPFAGAFKLLYDNCEGFRDTVNNMVDRVKQAFTNMKDGISSTVGKIKDAIVNGIQKAVDFITGLPEKALQWGKDFIQGLIDGIKSMLGNITDAVSNVADTIFGWLHFSRPDKGPLRQYETWMPDMMSGMAKGIEENSWMLEDALNAATSHLGVSANINGGTGKTVNMGGINITINAAEGMDVNALADAVAYKIQTMTKQREAVW